MDIEDGQQSRGGSCRTGFEDGQSEGNSTNASANTAQLAYNHKERAKENIRLVNEKANLEKELTDKAEESRALPDAMEKLVGRMKSYRLFWQQDGDDDVMNDEAGVKPAYCTGPDEC